MHIHVLTSIIISLFSENLRQGLIKKSWKNLNQL